MKTSGVSTLKERRKEESEENIEKEVRGIIEEYRNKMRKVTEHYQTKTNFISEDWINEDTYQLNRKIEAALGKQDVRPVTKVPIHFLIGNDPKEIDAFAVRLSRKFGLLAWGLEELISEARSRPECKKETEVSLAEMEEEFIVRLIVRQIERNNYKGPFLFWGYPRK